MRDRRLRAVLVAGALVALLGSGAGVPVSGRSATSAGPVFAAGAAVAGIDPPLRGTVRGPRPWDCDPTGQFDGPRQFDFEEPYKDTLAKGHYVWGEPYLDCNGNGRYDGIFITSGDLDRPLILKDPIEARAFVVSNGTRKIAVEVVDSIGIFNVEMDEIRARVREQDPTLDEMFISSTHDESAPDPIGLWGPTTGVSGVDDYYMDYLAETGAQAIVAADKGVQPAQIRYAQVPQPPQFQTCWSSYPYVQDRMVRVLQALSVGTGKPIVTLSNYGIHAETMSFSPNPTENRYVSADWPHFERAKLDRDLGGVSIHMAGAVGSVETPRVFTSGVTSSPTSVQHPDHPADCHTTDSPLDPATLVPWSTPSQAIGYDNETRAVGEYLAVSVENALTDNAVWASSTDISFAREKFGLPLGNLLFFAVAPAGLFAHKPGCVAGRPMPVAPNGSTTGTETCTEVSAYTIGDAEFLGVPGEVFPYVIIRGFQGAQDMPFPEEQMSPWVMPHASKPFRFVEGLGEDMDGYLFSQNDATGVPEAEPQRGVYVPGDDRFGCSHDDDSEAASGNAGTIVADHLMHVMSLLGTDEHQRAEVGRYVLPGGTLSRNPIGSGPLRCDKPSDVFNPAGSGAKKIRVWLNGTPIDIVPAGFIDSSGRPQASPDMSTRGVWVRGAHEASFTEGLSVRIWLDVFPEVPAP